MDAAWALPESPYDLLGIDDDCNTSDVKKAYRDMARLFHPDRNTDCKDIETRTAHFIKVKKAYETLRDPGSRKLYDGCLLARERLVRKNLYKYAVSNTPEFRDVVDAQFADSVLDPEKDVAGDALVLCCESCGAPSKFRCSICDRLVCAFCQLKQHAFDGIPPHYPAKFTPRYRRQIESDGRLRRLLAHQKDVGDRPWAKNDTDRAFHRRKVALLQRKVDPDDRAPLSLTYGWCQTQVAVYVAVFVPGLGDDDDAVRVSLKNNRLQVGPRAGAAIVDSALAGHAMGALECVVFGSAEVCVVRAQKGDLGEVWRELFEGDSLLLRDAGDHDGHAWWREDEDFREPEPTFGVDVFVPRDCAVEDVAVDLTAKHLIVSVAGWGVFERHWAYTCRSDEASWHLLDDDGRRKVRIDCRFRGLPTNGPKTKAPDAVPRDAVTDVFVEDGDAYATLAVAQLGAFLDVGATFCEEAELLPAAQKLLKAMRRERPRADRASELVCPWSCLDVDLEDVRKWHLSASLLREDAWVSSQVKGAAPPYVERPSSIPSKSRELTTFAWDGADQGTVKLYLSLGPFLSELRASDVAVRFSSDKVRVRVRDLTFERKLFAAIKPSKCGFKVHADWLMVVVALRKKRKEVPWPAFAADVNADPEP